ncbi:MAG: tol-pal system protein YbgF [Pseudohongiella sp.]|nr:tol-pal system protein YbgF [Pseudohongiella sp.]
MNRFQAKFAGVVTAVVLSTTAFASSEGSVSVMGQAGIGPIVFAAQVGASNNDALLLLLDQFTALRGEMETLRGMVEEQAYEIRRLQQDSLDRYTDLDSRLSSIYQEMDAAPVTSGTAATAPQVASTTPTAAGVSAGAITTASPVNTPAGAVASQNSPATTPVSTTVGAGVSSVPAIQTGILTEQQLYELALDSLLQEQQFQTSISQFGQYLSQYPDGRFVTNAYYWQGQAYVNLSMFNEARQAFETILTQYPDGRKIEDAMYSLGAVYHRLGDNTKARQMLQDVMTRFPNTSAANLADIYLRSIN